MVTHLNPCSQREAHWYCSSYKTGAPVLSKNMETSGNATNQTAMGSKFSPVFDTILVLIAVVIILVNGLVINLFICKPFLREVTNYFLVSLAVSDGLTGLLVIPIRLGCVVSREITLCFSFDMAHRLTAFATVYHLLLITSDRYVAITRPFRHSSIFTSTVSAALLGLVWSISLFLPLVQLSWYDVGNLTDARPWIRSCELHYNVICMIIAFLLPVIVMILAYAEMLRIVTRHARAIEATTREKLVLSKEKRAMVIFGTMLLIYIICWFSFFFMALNDDLDHTITHLPFALAQTMYYFRFCTSIFNPLLYVFFKTDFKKALREYVSGFRAQSYSISNNDDDSSPPAAPRTHKLRPRT